MNDSILHVLDVLVEVLDLHKIKYFLSAGGLIGIARHGGIIPWDDDVDIEVSIHDVERAKSLLCCIDGFSISMLYKKHWKFFSSSSFVIPNSPTVRYPYIDIFFNDEDEECLWRLEEERIKKLHFHKSDIFPLASAPLDGKLYKVPRNMGKVIAQRYTNVCTCMSPMRNHRYKYTYDPKSRSKVPCEKLRIFYPILNCSAKRKPGKR